MRRVALFFALSLLFFGAAASGDSPAVIAAPASQSTTAWTGAYYSNRSLQGDPVFTRADADINFFWGNSAPDARLPADDFSVRWTRWVYMDAPGVWTFTAITDDGVRLYVDDELVIDAWSDQVAAAHTAALNLTQAFHLIRIEYYDHSGSAQAQFLSISGSYPDWRGEYYANPNLTGAPAFVRNDSMVNFNFGTAGPGGGVPGSSFSARWMRAIYLEGGRYRFTTLTDDGVRLWVDNNLVVDKWQDQTAKSWTGDLSVQTGLHLVKLEYYNRGGAGLAVVSWLPVPGSADLWRGEYFNNPGVSGSPALTRDHLDLNFDWGTAVPGAGIGSALNWSARFSSRRAANQTGFYTVQATADDGVRVWVDNNLLIDHWHDQPPTTYGAAVYLTAGVHEWHVEFYQHNGAASLRVQIGYGMAAPSASGVVVSGAADIVVDDNSPGFVKGGTASNWRDSALGIGKHAFSFQNNNFSTPLYNWARWYPRLSQPGVYEVFVYIPANLATTRNARYWIHHDGVEHQRRVFQGLYSDQWISLGAYYFRATGTEYVSLSDVTFEPPLSAVIAIDAVMFSPR